MPKPAHLDATSAAQFEDTSVAEVYHTRPPYPAELFDALVALMAPGVRRVLDLGCGTGEIALGLGSRVDAIDAVDPSAAMLRVARMRPGATDPAVRWIHATAEAVPLDGPYALVVASESLHWMDWLVVLPKLARALAPVGRLAIADGRHFFRLPWEADLQPLLQTYSTNRAYQRFDLVTALTERRLFTEEGRLTTRPVAFVQRVDDYVESFHTRNGFSRARLAPEAAAAFDHGVRRLVADHCPDGIVRGETRATLIWGRPSGG